MMNPPYAPRPQSVEVKVSYGVRIGFMSALATPFLLVAIWAVVGSFFFGPKTKAHVLISRGSRYEREIGFQLIFARRTAEIVYRPVRNLAEVKPIIEALRQKRNPWI